MKLYLAPKFQPVDKADGGVRRVVEAQRRYLPALGFEIVDEPYQAELIAVHAGSYIPRTGTRAINPDAARVFHCHGLYWDGYDWPKWAGKHNQGLIENARLSDLTITPCEWVADVFRREMWLDPTVVYNGIDLPDKPGTSQGYVLWNKARTNAICDPMPLAQLARIAPNVPFVSTFLPEGIDLSNVMQTGAVPYEKALDLVSHAGLYLATTREVFSVSVLEALSYGVPVLGFDWGGTSEAIEHKVSGYLVKPGDIDGLLGGIEYCRAHRKELSDGARERAKLFSWDKAIVGYSNAYQDALAVSNIQRLNGVKISVVIPCYNLGRYLLEAIQSVLTQQNAPPTEIIVVDDHSDDPETIKIIDQLKARPPNVNVTVLRTLKNQYLAETLNTGYSRAAGDYFLSLDADNLLPQNALAILSGALDRDEALDVAYGAVQIIREDGSIETTYGPNGMPKPSWPPDSFRLDRQLSRLNQVSSTCLMRRKVWERTGGYRQHATYGDDADLWCRAGALGFKFAKVTTLPTFQYRQRKDSMTATSPDATTYDWTSWTPKHRPLLPIDMRPRIPEPKISVVLKDPGNFSREAVESLWAQSFDDWEVVVPTAVYREPLPPYVKLGEPRGELILELASWEWLDRDALELLYMAYNEQSGPRFVYSDWKSYDQGLRGNWHRIFTGDKDGSMAGPVGALLYPRNAPNLENFHAIHLPIPVLNRRNGKGERPMACATCGGGSRARVRRQTVQQEVQLMAQPSGPTDDTVLVEFIGSGSRTVPMPGGITYRFGADPEHRVRSVRRNHLPRFTNSKEFRPYAPAMPVVPEPPVVDTAEAVKEPVAAVRTSR